MISPLARLIMALSVRRANAAHSRSRRPFLQELTDVRVGQAGQPRLIAISARCNRSDMASTAIFDDVGCPAAIAWTELRAGAPDCLGVGTDIALVNKAGARIQERQ